MEKTTVVSLENAGFTYSKGTPFENTVLSEISLEISSGDLFCLAGETGAGKTTLAQMIAGLIKPSSGRLLVNYCRDHSSNSSIGAGFAFQYPEHQLFGETVFEDISAGLREFDLSEKEILKRVESACSILEIRPAVLNRSPFSLSGGEMRKVALAGILCLDPEILILDEPTVGLDPWSRDEFIRLLQRIHSGGNTAVIVITHDSELMRICSSICVLEQGRIRFLGTPSALFADQALFENLSFCTPLELKAARIIRNDADPGLFCCRKEECAENLLKLFKDFL